MDINELRCMFETVKLYKTVNGNYLNMIATDRNILTATMIRGVKTSIHTDRSGPHIL